MQHQGSCHISPHSDARRQHSGQHIHPTLGGQISSGGGFLLSFQILEPFGVLGSQHLDRPEKQAEPVADQLSGHIGVCGGHQERHTVILQPLELLLHSRTEVIIGNQHRYKLARRGNIGHLAAVLGVLQLHRTVWRRNAVVFQKIPVAHQHTLTMNPSHQSPLILVGETVYRRQPALLADDLLKDMVQRGIHRLKHGRRLQQGFIQKPGLKGLDPMKHHRVLWKQGIAVQHHRIGIGELADSRIPHYHGVQFGNPFAQPKHREIHGKHGAHWHAHAHAQGKGGYRGKQVPGNKIADDAKR